MHKKVNLLLALASTLAISTALAGHPHESAPVVDSGHAHQSARHDDGMDHSNCHQHKNASAESDTVEDAKAKEAAEPEKGRQARPSNITRKHHHRR